MLNVKKEKDVLYPPARFNENRGYDDEYDDEDGQGEVCATS